MNTSSSSLGTYGRLSGTATSTQSFRSQFSQDLSGHVLYNRQAVINKLLASNQPSDISTDENVVDGIMRQVNLECETAFKELREVSRDAATNKSEKKPEKFMYQPLTMIFDAIDNARYKINPSRARGYFRQLICCGDTPLVAHDPVQPKAFKTKPDFVVAELPPPESPNDPSIRKNISQVLWRQCPSILEVKATAESDNSPIPSSSHPSLVKSTLTQCVDYARAILNARPFQVFVFGVILCGGEFWVGLFDRRGIALSPSYSIFEDAGLSMFIRVVLRLTWEMSSYDLGQDPSTRLLEGYTFYGSDYPRFAVGMGGTLDTRRWRTVGEPLWISHTLLGRGTSVWRVVGGDNKPAILKVAWRSEKRRAEAEIYHDIMKLLGGTSVRGMVIFQPGFVWGGDVRFPGEGGAPISVYNLRGLDPNLRPASVDVRLHRVAFPDFGKPLWKYTNPEQLVRAMYMTLQAHQILCDRGVLHRDISAGNILIRMDATYKDGEIVQRELDLASTEGFLTDFELAALPDEEAKEDVVPMRCDATSGDPFVHVSTEGTALEQTSHHDTLQNSKIKFVLHTISNSRTAPGDGMTGTAIFMASELLYAIKHNKPISRTVAQDVESFAWVFIYVVYKHAVDEPDESGRMDKSFREALRKDFDGLFSGVSVSALYDNRALRLRAPEGAENLIKYASVCVQDDGKLSGLVEWAWSILMYLLPDTAPIRTDFGKKLNARAHPDAEVRSAGISNVVVRPKLAHENLLLALQAYIDETAGSGQRRPS